MADIAVALVLVVSPLAFDAVSLFILLFCFSFRVLLRDGEEFREVGRVHVVLDGNRSGGVESCTGNSVGLSLS